MFESIPRRRPELASITLYSPDRHSCPIDLSDNTNRWGAPPAAQRALQHSPIDALTRYPSPYGAELKQALAVYLGVSSEQIATGCGSDDLLDSAIRAFGSPGDRIAVIDPSFAMIPLFARVNGLQAVLVPLTRDYDVDANAMLAADANIIYLCSPNNPTGTALDPAAITAIVEQARGIVIVDEAYAEFASGSAMSLVKRSPRVLVTRTLSKAFGLAGLRVGYAVGDPTLVAEVEKSRGPYKVNAVAERAAVAVLSEDLAWVREKVDAARTNRARFRLALGELGFDILPSDANFVLVPVRDPARIARSLRELGIAVRPFENLAPVSAALAATSGGAIRITIGPWDMLDATLVALREVIA